MIRSKYGYTTKTEVQIYGDLDKWLSDKRNNARATPKNMKPINEKQGKPNTRCWKRSNEFQSR